MHKNLFTSLLLSSLCVVIFESSFIMDSINNPDDSMVEANGAGCKIFYTITKYLRLSTYTWMFCEGYYLHKLIAAAFAEQKSYHVFYIIGWGAPVIPVLIWAVIRQTKADEACWIVPAEKYEWVLLAPMLVALVVNFCFLAHIIQVVVTKLRSTNIDEPTQFRRAVRATMVLIPLFGLHFLLISYHPTKGDCYILQVYNIATYSMDGLQGGIVSLIFCYFNNEVLFLLKRTYSRKKMFRDISSHMSSRKKSRESRTSVSTNAESIVNENGVVMIKK
ncbi:Calcitonin receptor, partial [Stegodyphus mimosarum]